MQVTQRVEGGLTYTQTFDAENRLISVTVSGQTTQFVYDGDGNLVKKIKPDGSKTIYPSTGLRAGVGGIYEVDKTSGGSVTRTVTYYPAGGAMRINSTLYYILKDHLGSASVVTDASGNIVGENRYYPFGETRAATGSILTDRLFTGQREMTGLGIYHYGARFYSPKLGRFLSPDSIVPGYANPQNLNRFSYVTNNPLRYTDPTGHWEDEGCGTGGPGGGTGCNLPPAPGGGNDGGKDDGGGNACSGPNPSVVCLPTPTPTPTPTPFPTSTPTPYPGPMYTNPQPPQPYLDFDFYVDWDNVDELQAALDVAGIGGDIALVAFPEGPGEIADAVITFVEVVATGKALIDAAEGSPGGLIQTIETNGIEANLRLLARSTRWIPLAGSVASGYSLYDNFKGDITITVTTKYK